jgi:hypothetical protein
VSTACAERRGMRRLLALNDEGCVDCLRTYGIERGLKDRGKRVVMEGYGVAWTRELQVCE